MDLTPILLIISAILDLLTPISASIPYCCDGDNYLIDKHCQNSTNITNLKCQNKYLLENQKYNNDFYIDNNSDILYVSKHPIQVEEYCQTKNNNATVFLVCFPPKDDWEVTRFTVFSILELISVFFIILTIFAYCQVAGMLDLEGICIINTISGLGFSFLMFAANQLNPFHIETTFCTINAFFSYFVMMYAFFWLNLLSFHIWRLVVNPNFFKNKFENVNWIAFSFKIGIIGPLICVAIVSSNHFFRDIDSDFHPGFGQGKCWFKTMQSQVLHVYGPIAILLALNILYLCSTIYYLFKQMNDLRENKRKKIMYKIVLFIKLFAIMGIFWIFEIISVIDQDHSNSIFWFITDCINTLQGIILFLVLVVSRKRVVRGLANRTYCGLRLPSRWSTAQDDEVDEVEEVLTLSGIQQANN